MDTAGFLENLQSIFTQNSAVLATQSSNAKGLSNERGQRGPSKKANLTKTAQLKVKFLQKPRARSGHLTQLVQKPVERDREQGRDTSLLILGGIDESLFSGDLQYHPVIRKSWWTLRLDRVLVGGVDSELCDDRDKQCQIIMDSGASLMATPPQVFNEFMAKVEPKRHCEDLRKYPRISFVIDGKEYSLDPYEYILSNKEDIDYLDAPQKKDCVVGFSVFDLGPSEMVWIAGDIFLSKYYSVYDRDNNRVGLALAN